MLREDQIQAMMEKTVRMVDDMAGHTMDECLHMIAAAIGVILIQEEDVQVREEMLQELTRIIRSSVYNTSEDGIVYVDKVIEE